MLRSMLHHRLTAQQRSALRSTANSISHWLALLGRSPDLQAPLEMRDRFTSMAEWEAWEAAYPADKQAVIRKQILNSVRRNGFVEPLTKRIVRPSEIGIDTRNVRESIQAHGLNARMRALLLVVEDYCRGRDAVRILVPEAITPLARVLAANFPNFRGTEYLPTEASKLARPGVEHLDIQEMPYPSASFDLFVSAEVMEHVPRPDRAIAEIARVLTTRGAVISTFPFRVDQTETETKAELGPEREIIHHGTPEYHGNPLDPQGGALVFTVPGWDILDAYRQVGFADVVFCGICSAQHGILSQGSPLVQVLLASKVSNFSAGLFNHSHAVA